MARIASGPAIGTEFAGYRIDSLLGQGGMGAVYLTTHVRLGRRAALKLLLPGYAADEDFRERFIRESQVAASLDHPNIVPVYDADEEQGVLYIAMRYVQGEDLGSLLRREGRLTPDHALAVIQQAASALDAAHAAGLVHRDVKPGNILIAAPGEHVYLTDFGVAKQATAPGLTRTGSFIGTVDYSAPEQIEGKEVDARTDVYALGCVLFECLTGRPPFVKESEVAVLHGHLLEPPAAVSSLRSDLPEALDEVIATALAKRPDHRHPSSTALALALREALSEPPPAAPATVPTERASAPATTAVRPEAPAPAPTVEHPPGLPPYEGPRREEFRELPTRGLDRPRRKPLVIVGILALAGTAAAAAVLLSRGGEKKTQPPSTPVVIPRSERPALAVVGGSVYVGNPRGRIVRLDSTSLANQGSAANGAHPRAIVSASGNILVADDRALTWLRAKDFSPVAAVDFGSSPMLAAAAGAPVAATRPAGAGDGRVCVVREAALGPCADLAFAPSGLGVAPGGRIFVAHADSGSVLPFRLESGRLVVGNPLEVPGKPSGNLIESRGSLYAVVANGVAVVDLQGRKPLRTIVLGTTPSAIWIARATGRLFVALPGSGEVAVLDATAPEATPQRVKVGKRPAALASSSDSVFVVNVGDATVARLDPLTGEVLGSKRVAALRAKPIGALAATRVSLAKVDRTTTATIVLAGGTLAAKGLVPRDTAIADGRASIELWQGGISTKVRENQLGGLAIRIRRAAGRLVVTVTAKPGAFEAFAARLGPGARSVLLVLTQAPPPTPTPTPTPTTPTPTPEIG